MSEIPKSVPLPDVPTYTEDVIFSNLNLPIGFDEERLYVNLRAFHRVRAIAGLASISIKAVDGKSTEHDIGISALDSSGAAALGGSTKLTKQPLSTGNIEFPIDGNSYVWNPDVTIGINRKEMNERIKSSNSKRGALDAKLQAELLNAGIKTGLCDASRSANFDHQKMVGSARYYGFMNALALLGGTDASHLLRSESFIFALGPIITNVAVAQQIYLHNITDRQGLSPVRIRDALRAWRQSAFVGCAVDRYIGSAALISTNRFIKAQL